MRYPGATWKPLPQNATQTRISPTQVILHSATSPDIEQVWGFFAKGSGGAHTESHFIVGYDGSVIQCLDTLVRGDAQFTGNLHGISIETASNVQASDAWTPAQQQAIVKLGTWLMTVHKAILPRQCPSALEPGFGYHRLFGEWNQSNHSCPGNLRVKQFPLLLAQIIAPQAPHKPTPQPPAVKESEMFLFTYTIPGHPSARFISDGVNFYRWIAGADETAFLAAGVHNIAHPTYIATMTLVGPAPS